MARSDQGLSRRLFLRLFYRNMQVVNRRFLMTLRLALHSLLVHKLRSGLAVLGIFIGVTAVVWLVALGEGVSYQAQEQIKNLGATNIIVRSVKPPEDSSEENRSGFLEYGLTRDDFRRIVSNIPTIFYAVPMREIRREIRVRDRVVDVQLVGCTPDYLTLNQLEVARGRFLSHRDDKDNVIVLADETAQILFPYEDPIGRTVQVDEYRMVVVGQTAARTASAAIGGSLAARDYNLDAYIPLGTLRNRIGDQVITARSGSFEGEIVQLTQITLRVREMDEVDPTADVVRMLLDKYHEKADYAVVVPKELLEQAERMRMLFNALLVLIAGISLAVGGIGIMNIMLATVTERTREIGIRRAMGATRRDIIRQFLTEAVMLTTFGGLLGVGSGFLCGPAFRGLRHVVGSAIPEALSPSFQSLEPRIAPWSIVISFAISVGVGLAFGIYPARRAAFMDPIEALRHE